MKTFFFYLTFASLLTIITGGIFNTNLKYNYQYQNSQKPIAKGLNPPTRTEDREKEKDESIKKSTISINWIVL